MNETVSMIIYNTLSNVDTKQGLKRKLEIDTLSEEVCVVKLEVSEGEVDNEEVAQVVAFDIGRQDISKGFKKKYGIDNGAGEPVTVKVEIDFK